MAGLSSFLSDTTTKATSLPSWYDQAQQKISNSAQAGVNAMPALQNTLAGKAIDTLAGPNNPFAQAGAAAQSIATGAASPWNVSSTGQVTPNTNTAMGGLFQAQNQQLNQLMPNIKASPEASNLVSGNFGSLRGQTAINKAMGDAQANLFAQQNTAALNNQQTGVAAAGQVGNLANQSITNQTALGQLQQMDPTMQSATLAKIIGAINNVPTSVTQSAQLSPLSQIGALSNGAQSGAEAANSILSQLGYKGGLSGIGTAISGGVSKLFNGQSAADSGISVDASGNAVPGTYTLADGKQLTINGDGSQSVKGPDGVVQNFNPEGTPYIDATNSGEPPPVIEPSYPTDSSGAIDYSGDNWGEG